MQLKLICGFAETYAANIYPGDSEIQRRVIGSNIDSFRRGFIDYQVLNKVGI